MNKLFYTKILRKFSFAIILSTVLFHFTSCDDSFFKRVSTPATTYSSLKEAESGIFSPYQQLLHGSDRSPLWMLNFNHLAMSDIVRKLGDNSAYNPMYERRTSEQVKFVQRMFQPGYQIISNCNFMIEFLEEDPFPDISDFDRSNNLNRLLGEAYFLRAFTYLQLASHFCPAYDPNGTNDEKLISLRTKFAKTMDIALDVESVETYKIYDQMVSDLEKAENLLPKKFIPGMHSSYQYGRATKHAAMAVLAKVYMLMGRYDEALVKLNGVLNDSELSHALEPDPRNCFLNNSSTGWNSSENIWYAYFADPDLPSTVAYRHINDAWTWYINYTFALVNTYKEWYAYALDKNILKRAGIINNDETDTEAWKADKRRKLFKRFEGWKLGNVVIKGRSRLAASGYGAYVGENDVVYLADKFSIVPDSANYQNPFQNVPIIRSAELYLMRAGIKALKSLGGQAADLNIVRSRSWDTSIGGAYQPLNDNQVNWELVDNEWIKELAFESDRIMWLQSFKKPIGPGDRNVPAINPPYDNFFWPALQSELDFQKIWK